MKKSSIKNKLFIWLSALIFTALLVVSIVSFFNTKQEIEEVFEYHLTNHHLFASAIDHKKIDEEKHELILKVLETLSISLAASFIPLLIIIWIVINKGLNPLQIILKEIEKISSSNLVLLSKTKKTPREIEPLIDAMNALLLRLTTSLAAEKRFIDYAAHELRTPLSTIKTQTQLLLRKNEKNKDEELQNDLTTLVDSTERTIHLANQLLILARLDPENYNSDNKKLNLKLPLEQAMASYYDQAAKKNIHFQIKTEDCFLFANKTYLEVMFNNLIDNAVRYGEENNAIEVYLGKTDRQIVFKISNHGKTISQTELTKIFDKFYRPAGSNLSGSGLGLAIVKKITDLYEGETRFTSKEEVNEVQIVFTEKKVLA